MNPSEGLYRFQFDQNLPSDNKIRSKALIEAFPAKVNCNWLLPFDCKSTLYERVRQQYFVNRFKKPWSKFFMNFKRAINH